MRSHKKMAAPTSAPMIPRTVVHVVPQPSTPTIVVAAPTRANAPPRPIRIQSLSPGFDVVLEGMGPLGRGWRAYVPTEGCFKEEWVVLNQLSDTSVLAHPLHDGTPDGHSREDALG